MIFSLKMCNDITKHQSTKDKVSRHDNLSCNKKSTFSYKEFSSQKKDRNYDCKKEKTSLHYFKENMHNYLQESKLFNTI